MMLELTPYSVNLLKSFCEFAVSKNNEIIIKFEFKKVNHLIIEYIFSHYLRILRCTVRNGNDIHFTVVNFHSYLLCIPLIIYLY